MNHASHEQMALLETVKRQTGADSATLFVYDRCALQQPVHFLFNLGPTTETNRAYQDSICRQDPFLRLAGTARASDPGGLRMIDQDEVESTAMNAGARSYWEFMQRRGYCESAASIREISRGIYLVLGLMRDQRSPGGARLSGQPARAAMQHLFDHTAATIVDTAIRRLLDAGADAPPPAPDRQPLTMREQEVALALCRGLSNKQIAAALRLSEYTVENHLRRIYRKHGVHNRTSLMAMRSTVMGSVPP